ncbi:MAG: hypothetical protein NDJ89_09390 [Oligoflexia bacterium]|nr:hypothetical protein [Oligoflexia bacterium]
MKTLSRILFLVPLLTMLGSSCARFGKAYVPRASESSYSRSPALAFESESASEYACPSVSNVNPDYDRMLDGSGYFTVCPSNQDSSKLLIHGQTAESERICIFPAQYIDSRHIYWKPELAGGLPWTECALPTEQGAFAQFPGVNYNAVFIVEERFRDQMQLCLSNGDYYGCPAYSFGRFR